MMPKVKEILKKVKNLEIKTNRPVDGLIAGNYHSVFKGRGIEFSEVREYIPGDDVRAIDWNVTARFNAPFIKEFIEERDLDIYIVFDMSASSEFGSEKSKKDTGLEIAASIMFSALRNNDNIGLCLFTDHIEKFLRPRKGRSFALKLLRFLVYYEPESRGTDLNASLMQLTRIIKRRGIVFIVSDFLSGDFEKPVRYLKNRHDVILINLYDIREEDIPDIGYAFIEDNETGEQVLVNTSDNEFRKAYAEEIRKRRTRLLGKLKKMKIDMIQINTSEPFQVPLRRFFDSRKRRMVR
jgi:uncharacterized protein (DUF58 family)